jgi:hypothetical protein
MVKLGKGQTIIGGYVEYQHIKDYHRKVYRIDCSNRNCSISVLKAELSLSRSTEVLAIPIPDKISGCLTGGKIDFQNSNVPHDHMIKWYLCHPEI